MIDKSWKLIGREKKVTKDEYRCLTGKGKEINVVWRWRTTRFRCKVGKAGKRNRRLVMFNRSCGVDWKSRKSWLTKDFNVERKNKDRLKKTKLMDVVQIIQRSDELSAWMKKGGLQFIIWISISAELLAANPEANSAQKSWRLEGSPVLFEQALAV